MRDMLLNRFSIRTHDLPTRAFRRADGMVVGAGQALG